MIQWPSQKASVRFNHKIWLLFAVYTHLPFKKESEYLDFVSIIFIMLCLCCWFLPTDSHSGEWWGSNIQPQPGRQHQQIPRYHLSHSQGKRLAHTERCGSAPGREGSQSELWFSNEGFYSGADSKCTYLSHSLRLSFCLFGSFTHSSVWFRCAHSSCLSQFKTPLQRLFVLLLVLTLPGHFVPRQSYHWLVLIMLFI